MRPLVLVTALAAAATAVLRRRQSQTHAAQLWREATADASR
jgi:hypothetical protein